MFAKLVAYAGSDVDKVLIVNVILNPRIIILPIITVIALLE